MKNFFDRVVAFNVMYGLPALPYPQLPKTAGQASFKALGDRLRLFKGIILAEVDEVNDIIAKIEAWGLGGEGAKGVDMMEVMTDLADWLGDLQVYAASESVRHGLPIEKVLQIIMDSNESKLGADGKPIVSDGKVQKGPGYWKPEPKIRQLLEDVSPAPWEAQDADDETYHPGLGR